MQDDVIEVTFCDLCGASVPIGDLTAGTAIRHAGKVVGVCCLSALRGGRPADATPGVAGAPRPGSDARLVTVAILLLAALAAATIFLDHRLTRVETDQRSNHDQLQQAQRSDSDVLAGIGVAMDAAARRSEVEALAKRVDDVTGALERGSGDVRKDLDAIRQELGAVASEQRAQAAKATDVRPLFDDLRERHQRLMEVVMAMRSAAPPADVSRDTPAPAPAPAAPPEGGAPVLPEALQKQIKNLGADEPAVRFEAVDELLRSKEPLVLPHLLPLARDPDSLVRRLTVEGLGSFKKAEAVDALLTSLTDADDSVREAAHRSLREITGQKFPFEGANASKDARSRAVQRWTDWWEKNKATFGS